MYMNSAGPPPPGGSRSASRRSGMDALVAQDQKSRSEARQIGSGTRYLPPPNPSDFRDSSSHAHGPRSIGHSRLSGDSEEDFDDEDVFARRDMDYQSEDSRMVSVNFICPRCTLKRYHEQVET